MAAQPTPTATIATTTRAEHNQPKATSTRVQCSVGFVLEFPQIFSLQFETKSEHCLSCASRGCVCVCVQVVCVCGTHSAGALLLLCITLYESASINVSVRA